jgi:prepilin-type N-terminal cleavage/methylation domain-containing protein
MFKIKESLLKKGDGFTLVEVIVAMFVIALASIGLIQGTMVALNTVKANKEKTIAVAIANEKVEILRGIDYEDIGLTDEDPGWDLAYPELSEDGYSIYYYSSWVDDEEKNYKQVMVSVNNTEACRSCDKDLSCTR